MIADIRAYERHWFTPNPPFNCISVGSDRWGYLMALSSFQKESTTLDTCRPQL